MSQTVEVEIDSHICTIRLNRPQALNALNQSMWKELREAVQRLSRESAVRAAIITGTGRAFCAGADLKEHPWRDATQAENRMRIEANQQKIARAMIDAPVPIIAAINGFAVGGGVEITLAADIRVASDEAQLWFPETSIGRFITGGASILLPRLVGLGHAKRLIYTGERVAANRALAIGLVEEVTAPGALMARCRAIADQIAENSTVSVTLSKRVLNRVSLSELDTALTMETEALISTYTTDEAQAGIQAFARRNASGLKKNDSSA